MNRKRAKGRKSAKRAEPQASVVGVGWYRPDDWARIKASATDGHLLENSFAEWESMAAGNLPLLQSRFPKIVKVHIAAEEFLVWCQLRGRANDAEARAEFVAEKVQAGALAAS